jgi:hypothetical protein
MDNPTDDGLKHIALLRSHTQTKYMQHHIATYLIERSLKLAATRVLNGDNSPLPNGQSPSVVLTKLAKVSKQTANQYAEVLVSRPDSYIPFSVDVEQQYLAAQRDIIAANGNKFKIDQAVESFRSLCSIIIERETPWH